MDKFSLYDFMSYFLPGVVGVLFLVKLFPEFSVINNYSEFVNGLLFTIVAIIAGITIHSITFFFIKSNWYKFLVMKPIDKIVKDNPTTIRNNYIKLNQEFNMDKLSPVALFDEAYYFLEYNDKIAVAKSFQSIYFFTRNLITLLFGIMIVFTILYFWQNDLAVKNSYKKFAALSPICIYILILVGTFYRTKMVERVFNTYYIAMKNKK